MTRSIVIVDTFSSSAVARLKAENNFNFIELAFDELSAHHLKKANALLIRSRNKVDQRLLEETMDLQLIVSATSGFDHIDLELCRSKNICVTYTPEANIESAACHTWTLLLALTRHLVTATKIVHDGHWRDHVPRGELLTNKTLGVIGLGRIGRRVAALGQAFRMNVIAFDPYQSQSIFENANIERVGQAELFRSSDVITLHVPLTRETRGLINHATLHSLNPDALLINTSRGGVIEETELSEALDEGILRGVALDVFENEPLAKKSPLRSHENVILSPHLGAFTHEALEAASHQAVDSVFDFFSTGQVLNSLPECLSWYEKVHAQSSKGNPSCQE